MAAKQPKPHLPRPDYRLKTATVQCAAVLDGETFSAIWESRRWGRKYTQKVEIRLAKIEFPGERNLAKYLNKPEVEFEIAQIQERFGAQPGVAEATVFLRQFEGKRLLIEYAQYPTGDIVKDEDGRLLAMVFTSHWFGGKGQNLCLEQVKRGYVKVAAPKNRQDAHYWSTEAYDREFQAAYTQAEQHRRGPLHKNKPPNGANNPDVQGRMMHLYYLLYFLAGFLAGLLTYALLLNFGVAIVPIQFLAP